MKKPKLKTNLVKLMMKIIKNERVCREIYTRHYPVLLIYQSRDKAVADNSGNKQERVLSYLK